MKNILISFIALMFYLPAWGLYDYAPKRSNQLLRFLAQSKKIRNVALFSVVSRRCNRYLPLAERDLCHKAVATSVQLLDFDILFDEKKANGSTDDTWNPNSFVFVAFKKDFLRLLEDQGTEVFLKELNIRLNKFLTGDDGNLNIWELALTHFKSHSEAARALAVLFQDTSLDKLHLAYLEKKKVRGRLAFENNKVLLSRVINTVNLVLDYSEDNFQRLFYPKYVQQNLNRNIYHFYVPLYLTMALEHSKISKKYSFIASFLLGLSYEFVTIAHDYRYLFHDPETLDPDLHLGKLKDIYGGYCGANFGAKGPKFHRNFELLKESFARSTKEAVLLLINH